MSTPGRPPESQRKRGWQQQAIGVILITLLIVVYVVVRYRHALLK